MTAGEARAFWRELQDGLKNINTIVRPPAWRRRRTGEMRLTHTERRAMQAFHLLRGENYLALARRFRRDNHYMPRWIWDEKYRAFHAHYWRTDAGHAFVERRGRKPARRDVVSLV